jgi:hypothetical protein
VQVSDQYICIIPKDPLFVPGSAAELEEAMRGMMTDAEEIAVEVDPVIRFRDCGENFASVHCPQCRAEIAVPEWQDMMDADLIDEERGFALRGVTMSCCGRALTLNDLDYDFAQGFSRFMISAMNPARDELGAAEILRLERAMGSPVTVIYLQL